MFNTPYETTPCASYVLKDSVSALKHALVSDDLQIARTVKGTPLQGIYTVPSYLKGIAPFFHPLVFDHNGRQVVAIDTRAYLKTNAAGQSVISQPAEYGFLLVRAALVKLWADGEQSALLAAADLPASVFMRWVSESLVRRLGLSPSDQQALVALSGFFYFSQFTNEPMTDERSHINVASRIARLTRVPVAVTLELLRDAGRVDSVFEFVELLKARVQSPRMENLNPGLLYAVLGGSWFGAAGREIAGVALEYPPYLAAMIYTAVNDRSYRKTGLNKLVEQLDRNQAGKTFSHQIAHLMQGLTND